MDHEHSTGQTWPYLAPSMRVGLFGGTFDPVHDGHELVAKRAVKALGLNQLWWIPSHGNPLKVRRPTNYTQRVKKITERVVDPKQRVIDVEILSFSRYTVGQVHVLQKRYPDVHFVLIIGADLVEELPSWRDWDYIASSIPICIIARPNEQLRAGLSKFAMIYRKDRMSPSDVLLLPKTAAPAWVLLPGVSDNSSSTALRAASSL